MARGIDANRDNRNTRLHGTRLETAEKARGDESNLSPAMGWLDEGADYPYIRIALQQVYDFS